MEYTGLNPNQPGSGWLPIVGVLLGGKIHRIDNLSLATSLESGVYLLAANNDVVYIGQSSVMNQRLYAHKVFHSCATRPYVILFEQAIYARRVAVERFLSQFLRPSCNPEILGRGMRDDKITLLREMLTEYIGSIISTSLREAYKKSQPPAETNLRGYFECFPRNQRNPLYQLYVVAQEEIDLLLWFFGREEGSHHLSLLLPVDLQIMLYNLAHK